jgi:anaerobic magnesium-protoporphyrin IX monomethyl ester cyclase
MLLTFDWDLYDCLHPVLKTKLSPLLIYLKSNVSEYVFFLKKWISSVTAGGGNISEANSKYTELVQNASRFLAKNLFKYAKSLIVLPMHTLKLWAKLKKPKKLGQEILDEILNLTVNFERKTDLRGLTL